MRLGRKLLQRYSFDAWAKDVGASFNGHPLVAYQTYDQSPTEAVGHEFVSHVRNAYTANGIVFACQLARGLVFSEVEFAWQNMATRELYGTPQLAPLDAPGRMLMQMEQDGGALAGNAYVADRGGRLVRLRPDWVQILLGTDIEMSAGEEFVPGDIDTRIVGYQYKPGGFGGGGTGRTVTLHPEEVAHYAPIPDPLAHARGMSWLTPVVREVQADEAMTTHRNRFFDKAATPNMVLKVPAVLTDEQRERVQSDLARRHEGAENAYRTMLVEGGADVEVVGQSFEQMSFATVQAAGENRIASAAGVPSIIPGFKEGLQAATYSNYGQARRRFMDMTVRPLWRSAATALSSVVPPPAGSRLWFDDTRISALQEDAADAADIVQKKAATTLTLVNAGFDPDKAAEAAHNGDLRSVIGSHSGLTSVQLQPPAAPGGDDDD